MSFDVCGPLPGGTTVLEASAGTGKTWTIAALATRYVAEGHAQLSELLLATFSRAATQELRERVRDRFSATVRSLGADSDDPVVQHLSRCEPAELARRRERLVVALAQFDAATIATTHSFCSSVLDSLGTAGELDPGAVVVESVSALLDEVVDDLYLGKFARPDAGVPALSLADARSVAREAVADRQARLEPAAADPGSAAGQRVGLARAARRELARRKRAQGLRDYDDLLELLRDVLLDPVHGPTACRRLQQRYRIVLVDEFQDTDPVQWQVLRAAFQGASTLVLIGDPKQAVYAFRGAEVLSYLDAVQSAETHAGLTTNRRTDAALLSALDHLYAGAALGHERIRVPAVQSVHQRPRASGCAALRLRVLGRGGAGPVGTRGLPLIGPLREQVAGDVAAQVVALLDGPVRLRLERASGRPELLTPDPPHDHPGHPGELTQTRPARPPRATPVEPADIAVLVRNRRQGAAVQSALSALGVPCVLRGAGSVFSTEAARNWLWVLQAVEQPQRAGLVRLAACTPLIGRTAAELDADGEAVLEQVGALLREAGRRFTSAGAAAMTDQLMSSTGLDARLLAQHGGERRLTDLRHVAQLLHRTATDDSLGLSALLSWLGERLADPERGGVERTRRLETDAAAVQISTVHASKGLEHPVVLVPFGWDGARSSRPSTLRLHEADGTRVLDVGGDKGPGWSERRQQARAEDDAEELRLFYVAATRAQCLLVLWWAPSSGTDVSPLHRLLLGRRAGEAGVAPKVGVPTDAAALDSLQAWAHSAGSGSGIAVEPVVPAPHRAWQPTTEPTGPLAAAVFDRTLDLAWRRTSYSALTAAAHESQGASEAEQPGHSDEPDLAPLEPPDSLAEANARAGPTTALPLWTPSPFTGLPSGAVFGTLVHQVLESLDVGELPDALPLQCREAVAGSLSGVDPDLLADALFPVLGTPLGGLGTTLAQVHARDRLSELVFELPLSGGERPTAVSARLSGVADLLRTHLPRDDPLAGYADQLATLGAAPLRGYLNGSIDAVLRLPGPRYVVVDYKTNRLAAGELTLGHYTRPAMAAEMMRAHYPLQALLYSVALHRMLRWRQPGYDPQRHFGGVQYLFVRGMAGPGTPVGCGVFDWAPPAELVVALSDLLAGKPEPSMAAEPLTAAEPPTAGAEPPATVGDRLPGGVR